MQNLDISEGINSPKYFDCNILKCDVVDCSPLEKVEGLMDVKDGVIASLEEVSVGPEHGSSMEVDKDDFDRLRIIVMDSLEELGKYQKENEVLKQ